MAVAGDIIIKLAADFAEFAKGMEEGVGKLESFGKSAEKTGAKIEGFIENIKKVAAGFGVFEVYSRISEEAEKVAKSILAISEAAGRLDLTTNDVQALQQAATATGTKFSDLEGMYSRFAAAVRGGARGQKEMIDLFEQVGVKLLDANGQLKSTNQLFEEFSTKVARLPATQRGLVQDALLGKSGKSVDDVLGEVGKGFAKLGDDARAAGTYIDSGVVARMEELEKRSTIAKAKWDAFWAPIVTEVKTAALEGPVKMFESIQASLAATKPYEGLLDKIIAAASLDLRAKGAPTPLDESGGPRDSAAEIMLGNQAETRSAIEASTELWSGSLEKIRAKMLDVQESLKGAIALHGEGSVAAAHWRDEMAKLVGEADKLAKVLIDASAAMPTPPPVVGPKDFGLADWVKKGESQPPPKITPTGGGGQTDQENIDAQIRRYKALEDSANRAYATIAASRDKSIEDVQREVKVQQQVDDITAKLIAKRITYTKEQEKALHDQVAAAELAREATAKRLQYESDAEATERRMGDGTVALRKVYQDLGRQLETTRLSATGYTRALKEQYEATRSAALTAQRYDDDLGSLTAGFENAANQYARSNDLFAQGGNVFNASIDAMGQGLDVLVGKSNATFQQIAADFALMLAKMALQAAVSRVFSMVFGGGMGTAGLPGSPYFGPPAGLGPTTTARAGGGQVDAGQPYTVGEYGMERFVPQVSGRIEPNARSGDGTVIVNLDMKKAEGAADPAAALEFGRKVKVAVVDVIANEKRPGGSLYTRKTA